jgi:hypothetical protein
MYRYDESWSGFVTTITMTKILYSLQSTNIVKRSTKSIVNRIVMMIVGNPNGVPEVSVGNPNGVPEVSHVVSNVATKPSNKNVDIKVKNKKVGNRCVV